MRLLAPCGGVVVAVEDNALMVGDGVNDDLLYLGTQIRRLLQLIGKARQHVGHDGVDDDVRIGDGHGRAGRAEFKLIARKGEGRGTVAVGGVLGNAGQRFYAHVHGGFFTRDIGLVVLQRVQNAA